MYVWRGEREERKAARVCGCQREGGCVCFGTFRSVLFRFFSTTVRFLGTKIRPAESFSDEVDAQLLAGRVRIQVVFVDRTRVLNLFAVGAHDSIQNPRRTNENMLQVSTYVKTLIWF